MSPSQRGQRLGQPWTGSVAVGQPMIEIHAVIGHAEIAQNPPLSAEVLPRGRAPRVSDQHPSRECRTEASTIARPAVRLDDLASFAQ